MQLGVDVVSAQPWTGKPVTITSVAKSSKSPDSSKEPHQKSVVERAMDKAREKLGRRPSDALSLASNPK